MNLKFERRYLFAQTLGWQNINDNVVDDQLTMNHASSLTLRLPDCPQVVATLSRNTDSVREFFS